MENQKQTKDEKVEKKDILKEVKELDRKVRTRIVYEKIADIKRWAREIAELKQKTQYLLEELGVDDEDIKRLIDYATNSPEAKLSKEDLSDLKDEVKEMIAKSKKKVEKKMADASPSAYVMMAGAGGTVDTSGTSYTSTNTGISDGSATWTATGSTEDIDFKVN